MHPPLRLSWLLILLVGCQSADPCAQEGWLELRDREGAEPALEDGAVLAVERGSQGGQHVWASVVGAGVHPGSEDITEGLRLGDLPYISFELEGPDGIYSNENTLRQPLTRLSDGLVGVLGRQVPFRYWSVLPEHWSEIPIETRVQELEAMEFSLRARIDDACDDRYEVQTQVTLRFPE